MKGDLKDSESEEYLNLAKSGANQLAELINGISAFKQLENDATLSNYRPSNKIINEVITNLPKEVKENVEFTIETLPDVSVFHVHLYQLFQNLITNGLKYNESALKTLKVHYRKTEGHLEYIIEDNGIGIDPDYLSYIFEPFKKLHSSNKYIGTGLGLSICKKILEKNNGDIYASSNSKGSIFVMRFPLSMLRE